MLDHSLNGRHLTARNHQKDHLARFTRVHTGRFDTGPSSFHLTEDKFTDLLLPIGDDKQQLIIARTIDHKVDHARGDKDSD